MALRLILMRHAKSSWDDPLQDDHTRPLNARGKQSAVALGGWLRHRDYVPDAAISSDATRTRETFAGLGLDCPVTFTAALYHASSATLLAQMQEAVSPTLLMIAHNPGIGEFANRIVAEAPDHPRFFDYPTCATLVADFPQTTWAAAEFNTATARDFVLPRELL